NARVLPWVLAQTVRQRTLELGWIEPLLPLPVHLGRRPIGDHLPEAQERPAVSHQEMAGLPTADDGVQDGVQIIEKRPALAEGEIVAARYADPVAGIAAVDKSEI